MQAASIFHYGPSSDGQIKPDVASVGSLRSWKPRQGQLVVAMEPRLRVPIWRDLLPVSGRAFLS
jgi:hypothetical protein